MKRAWALFKSNPYISNVLGYTTLFASADLIQQSMLGGTQDRSTLSGDTSEQQASITNGEEVIEAGQSEQAQLKDSESSITTLGAMHSTVSVHSTPVHGINWAQTARVALVGLCFHSNFNYHWLRALEKMFPGGGAKRISVKVFLDQLVAAPVTISAFYIGKNILLLSHFGEIP